MRLAAAPISWGVSEVTGWGYQLDRGRVLTDAVSLGLPDIEAGPPGFLPPEAREAREIATRSGVRVIGGFVTAVLHRPERLDTELSTLATQAAWLAGVGSEVLVLAAVADRDGYDVPTVLTDAEWKTLLASLPRAVQVARDHGLAFALHPHVGSVVERPEAIARVLRGSAVPLCLDTGHIFVGGGDAAALAREHPDRIRHVHLKDADASLAAAVRERRIPYAEAVSRGVFRPLGAGDAGVGAVLDALRAIGYRGWGVLEQDKVLTEAPTETNDPARDIARSRDFVIAHG